MCVADVFTKKKRSQVMAAIRSSGNKDTELKLAAILRVSRIAGWRRHQPLPGRPDFAFRQERLAIFVDGCFWHGCPEHGRKPTSNQSYWLPKLRRNRERDAAAKRALVKAGWQLCAGGGGQAPGLEMAGFHHAATVEYEPQYCTTLRKNRPHWNVIQQDIRNLRHQDFTGVDLMAAGVPCPPFSIASKQLGADDDRDMFPAALELVAHIKPRGVLFENVPGFASAK